MLRVLKSMPDTLDGYGMFGPSRNAGLRRVEVPRKDYKITRMVGRREVVHKPEALNLRTRPSFCANSFVLSIACKNERMPRERGILLK